MTMRTQVVAALTSVITISMAVVAVTATPAVANEGNGWNHDGVFPAAGATQTIISRLVTPNQYDPGDPLPTANDAPLAVDSPDYTTTWGTQIHLFKSTGTTAQKWTMFDTGAGSGYFQYRPSYDTNLCMDVLGGWANQNNPVGIYGCLTGQANQLWKAEAVGDGWFKIKPKVAADNNVDRVLTVTGWSNDVVVATYTGSTAQQFRFYNPLVTKRVDMTFPNGSLIETVTSRCSSPYLLDEEGGEGDPSTEDVHYNKGPGDFSVSATEPSLDKFSLTFGRNAWGPSSVYANVYCNLDWGAY